ncbi:ParB/RepB/Spo0J family partition protein [Spiroplasma endosymbiont of 'Nebria riversi']|uniref:ParB/RepB/Spo0J family partition protein n=1 Tax=Spiroplasma endosymbiont of 'Nebria riversi' TaxID=2792084 RepID=UPI001C056DF3|nr:ParB/RepB/Spo0J family partition protein [Spiroplasma endosymbiont of 'Nebria riversi']
MAQNKELITKRRLSFKGLDKIFGEEINDLISEIETNDEIKQNAVEISLNEIRSNPYQPRIFFDDAEITQLGQSIVKHGLIQPIIVKKSINGYEVVAGERRMRACKKVGLTHIPAITINLSDKQMMEIALIENIQRVDLNTIEEAQAYRDLMNKLNLTQGEVAMQVGKSRSHIANIMRILNLPQKIQDYVLNGQLTMGQVKPLLALQDDMELVSRLSERIFKENLTSRKVEDIVRAYQLQIGKKDKNEQKFGVLSKWEYAPVAEKMIIILGTKVVIDDNRIIIKFSNDKDLNRILEVLKII